MPLRLRRGSNTDRLTFTPLEGELIYATDTKILWIGDGTTIGGQRVTGVVPESISDLNDVDTTTNPPTFGEVLKWDGFAFVPGDDSFSESLDDLTDVDLSNSPTIGQTLQWDGVAFVPGDLSTISIFDLDDVFTVTTPDLNNVLMWNGVSFEPQKIQTIEGDDSAIMLDTRTNTFIGNFNGQVTGNLQGSIFSEDSSILVDGDTGIIYGDVDNLNIKTSSLTTESIVILDDSVSTTGSSGIFLGTNKTINDGDIFTIFNAHNNTNESGGVIYIRARGTVTNPQPANDNDIIGSQGFAAVTDTGLSISTRIEYLIDGPITSGIAPGKIVFSTLNTSGTYNNITLLDSNGITTLTDVVAKSIEGDLVGSVFADDSTILVDAVNGIIPGYISIQELKDLTAASATFEDFKTNIAAL